MLTVFPFYEDDTDRMLQLLEWIHDLGGCPTHEALLVADAGVDWKVSREIVAASRTSFKKSTLITNGESVIGWIEGPKSLFLAAAQYASKKGVPFLQMETDAIPLKRGWMDTISEAYRQGGRPYMGHVYKNDLPQFPAFCLSGIAVYPPSVFSYKNAIAQGQCWDMTLSNFVIADTQPTKLIHHVWGERDNPPTFVRVKKDSSRQPFTLADIPKEAVVFHRNKDFSLVRLLWEKFGITKEIVCSLGETSA